MSSKGVVPVGLLAWLLDAREAEVSTYESDGNCTCGYRERPVRAMILESQDVSLGG